MGLSPESEVTVKIPPLDPREEIRQIKRTILWKCVVFAALLVTTLVLLETLAFPWCFLSSGVGLALLWASTESVKRDAGRIKEVVSQIGKVV